MTSDQARELREATERLEYEVRIDSKPDALIADLRVATAALRTIALPILEQDSELVGRIEGALRTKIYSEQTIASLRIRVLAALISAEENR